ncbi:hypothetical protein [Streptomyces umbrinus]|jgi:hypothetical protein|uniref:hypothetical protein n=1 Tax=Streptomyces umbrinus TaxID=67370 RepID=UPI0034115E5F
MRAFIHRIREEPLMVVRRRRVFIVISAALISAPAMLGLVGCDPDDAVDCVRAADALAESVGILGEAVKDAALYPENADQSIERVRENLDDLRDKHDGKDVLEAVDDMEEALDNVQEAVDNDDRTPDLSPVMSATGQITKACAS